MGKVAIHGFGRIGRSITKVALKNNLFSPFSVSDIRDIPTFAALFEVDTNYGRWHEEVKATETGFVIGGRAISSRLRSRPGINVCEKVSEAVGAVDAVAKQAEFN